MSLLRLQGVAAALCLLGSTAIAEPAESNGYVEDSECAVPSAEATAFLMDVLVADMLDPESDFTHQQYFGTPELEVIQAAEKAGKQSDWANTCRYRAANAEAMQVDPPRAVFMGDSITEFWSMGDPDLFGAGVLNRGISGQTSSQMVVRFWQDVVALKPDVVHIMAGTNDLAENTGHVSDETFKNNIRTMTTLAQANGIGVVLASIPPADMFGWRPQLKPAMRIEVLNDWLEAYAAETGAVFVDYHRLLTSDGDAMSPKLTHDGVHPHKLGYAAIHEAATDAIDRASALPN